MGFKVNFFKMSLHLFTWLTKSSISLLNFLLLLSSFSKSCDIILIVDKGVPRECAAAAT